MPTHSTVATADIDNTKNLRSDIGDVWRTARSVAEHGVLDPVIPVAKTRGHSYVAGHRRSAAAPSASEPGGRAAYGCEEIAAVATTADESDPGRSTLMMLKVGPPGPDR